MQQNNNKAVAALVLGIVGIVGAFIPYVSYVAFVASIVGIVMAVQAKKIAPSGMATAGLVLSIIALALDVILIFAGLCFAACAVGTLGALGGL